MKLLLLIPFLFVTHLKSTIRIKEHITPEKNKILLYYDNALEAAMINDWVIPIVYDINQAIKGGGPLFDEYFEEACETIYIEDNE